MNKAPAFQFYAADFLVGVMGMSDEEIGAYIKMLAIQWERGSLPENPISIKKLINSRKVPSDFLLEKFPLCGDGTRKNLRLEKEREKQQTFRQSRASNASRGWEKKRTSNARASSVHNGSTCINDALQSSSSSSDNSTLSIPSENEVTEFAAKQPGWSTEVVKQWFLDRSSQGWVKGSGVPITNWKADLEAWVLRQAQGNSPSGNQRGGRNQPQKPARTSKFAFEIPNHDDDEN